MTIRQERLLRFLLEKNTNGVVLFSIDDLDFYSSSNLFTDDVNELIKQEFIKKTQYADNMHWICFNISETNIKEYFNSLTYLKLHFLRKITELVDKNGEARFSDLLLNENTSKNKIIQIIKYLNKNGFIECIDCSSIDGYDFICRSITIDGYEVLETCCFDKKTSINIVDSFNTFNINFEQAKITINQLTSVDDNLKKETLEKIDEIKNIVNERLPKKKKWDKLKSILIWTADKAVDVGLTLLPLICNGMSS